MTVACASGLLLDAALRSASSRSESCASFALGLVDAVAMLPLAVSALATSGPILRAPLIVVVLFCIGCIAILTLGHRVARLPLVGRSRRLHTVYRRVADSTRFSSRSAHAGRPPR